MAKVKVSEKYIKLKGQGHKTKHNEMMWKVL